MQYFVALVDDCSAVMDANDTSKDRKRTRGSRENTEEVEENTAKRVKKENNRLSGQSPILLQMAETTVVKGI